MKYPNRMLHHTNWCLRPMLTRGLEVPLNDIFLMRCTLAVCSISWKITRTVVKKTGFKFVYFSGINKNVTVGSLQVQFEDYNARVEEISKRSVPAYHLVLSYEPKIWGNTFFSRVRYVVSVHAFRFLSTI